jgi:hypothetical protein
MRLEQWDLWNFRSSNQFSPSCELCRKPLQLGALIVLVTFKWRKIFYHSGCFEVAKRERSQERGD